MKQTYSQKSDLESIMIIFNFVKYLSATYATFLLLLAALQS